MKFVNANYLANNDLLPDRADKIAAPKMPCSIYNSHKGSQYNASIIDFIDICETSPKLTVVSFVVELVVRSSVRPLLSPSTRKQ